MKKCPNCGVDMPDDAVFCSGCGAQIAAIGPVVESVAAQPTINPVIAMIKQNGKSPAFLVAVIAYGCSVLFSFFSAVFSVIFSGTMSGYFDMIRGITGQSDIYEIVSGSYALYLFSAVIGCVIPALIFVGMLRFYLQCRQNGPYLNGSSLKLIRIPYLINYILSIIGLAFGVLVAFILFFISVAMSGELNDAFSELWYYARFYYDIDFFSGSNIAAILAGIIFVVFIILVAALVIEIIYGKKVLRSVKVVENAAATGAYPQPVSMFVIVLNYILAGLQVFSLFQLNLWAVLLSASSITALIAVSIAMQKYNKDVRMFLAQMQ